MSFLANETVGGIPIQYNWEFATAAARAVATDPYTGVAYKSADIGKVAKQTDDNSLWSLTAVTPTWKEILTAGNTAITDVATLADGKVWVGNGSSVPTAVTPSGDVAMTNAGAFTVTDLTITNEAAGDILYRNATNWVRLAKGTDTQVLTLASGLPSWATPSAGSSEKFFTFTLPGNCYVATTISFVLIGFTGTLTDAGAYAITAPTGASILIDVNKNGTSMFTTRLEIDASANADDGNRAIQTDGTEDVVDGDRVSIDIDQVGSTVAGANLSIYLKFA